MQREVVVAHDRQLFRPEAREGIVSRHVQTRDGRQAAKHHAVDHYRGHHFGTIERFVRRFFSFFLFFLFVSETDDNNDFVTVYENRIPFSRRVDINKRIRRGTRRRAASVVLVVRRSPSPWAREKRSETTKTRRNRLTATKKNHNVAGEQSLTYFLTRVQFNWNEVDYSVFSTYYFVCNLVGKYRTSVLVCGKANVYTVGSHFFPCEFQV